MPLRVGLAIHPAGVWRSLGRAVVEMDGLLAGAATVERLSDDFERWDRARQRAEARRFFERCDVVLGTQRQEVSRCRRELHPDGGGPRLVELTSGDGGRAGQMTMRIRPYLRTTDVLIASSEADRAAIAHLFPDADVRTVPLWIDPAAFQPAPPDQVAAYRRTQRIAEDDRVVLYVGRMTVEKNVHTLVRTFRAVLAAEPRALLVLVGGAAGQPEQFAETGVIVRDYGRLLRRTATELGVPRDRVRFVPFVAPDTLRLLYAAADVTTSLSLYHDEDFGYALVESMACGTPVVATAWGGHRDTVVDGETGFLAGTRPTEAGLKVDWWAAADRIAAILASGTLRAELGANGTRRVAATFGAAPVRERLLAVLREAAAGTRPGEPLRTSEAAQRLWATAGGASGLRYRFGEPSFAHYRELVAHYAGPGYRAAAGALVLCCPARARNGAIVVDDPLYPFALPVPPDLRSEVRAALRVMRRRPVLPEAELRSAASPACVDLLERLGVVMRSGAPAAREPVPPEVARPVLRYARVSEDADCLVP